MDSAFIGRQRRMHVSVAGRIIKQWLLMVCEYFSGNKIFSAQQQQHRWNLGSDFVYILLRTVSKTISPILKIFSY